MEGKKKNPIGTNANKTKVENQYPLGLEIEKNLVRSGMNTKSEIVHI